MIYIKNSLSQKMGSKFRLWKQFQNVSILLLHFLFDKFYEKILSWVNNKKDALNKIILTEGNVVYILIININCVGK